jgi:hypothetical protein
MSDNRRELFHSSDEREFKRAFTIQFMAALEAVHYDQNCTHGWRDHRVAVEDAAYMAEKAWADWLDIIGVQ